MSSTWRSRWKGTRHVPPSAVPVPIVAVRWLMRTITPVMPLPSRSSNVTVSPHRNSRALVAAVAGSGGGSEPYRTPALCPFQRSRLSTLADAVEAMVARSATRA